MPTATFLYWEDRLRATASVWLYNREGRLWVGHSVREDNKGGWQPPQGGRERAELNKPLRDYFRETWEEAGIRRSQLSLIAAANRFFNYALPVPRADDKYEWITLSPAAFLVRDGVTPVFDKTKDPEFDAGMWIAPQDLPDICPPHKRDVFRNIIAAFQPITEALRLLNVPAVPPLGQVVKAAMRNVTVKAALESKTLMRILPEFPGVLTDQNKL